MKLWHSLVSPLLFACMSPLFAQAAPKAQPEPAAAARQPPTLGEVDRNRDGKLSRSEIPVELRLLRARFADFDTNHDGYLEAGEVAAYIARSGGGAGLDMRRLGAGPTVILHPLEIPSGHGVTYD